jgi:putative oxidoreductase
MNDQRLADQGALLLRVALAAVFISHSVYLKLFVFTLPGTAQFFQSLGLPAALAYGVFLAEAVGGIALLLGVWTRWVALGLVPITLGATWAHLGNGWLFTNQGGGWEYPLFLVVALLVQALIGDGAYALRRSPALAAAPAHAARA